MHIVHITSELATVAKVGGLGDVVFGLSREQVKQGHSVSIIIGRYRHAEHKAVTDLRKVKTDCQVEFDGSKWDVTIEKGKLGEVEVFLVDTNHPEGFFAQEEVYGYSNDTSRFLCLVAISYAILKEPAKCKMRPFDMVHLHDWQSAPFSALAKQKGLNVKTVLTLHNIEHQGQASPEIFARAGIDHEGASSSLELGLLTASGLSAVSKTYLKEIQTADGGRGLDRLLKELVLKVPTKGIVNGIDENFWDPSDKVVSAPFSSKTLKFTSAKSQCEQKAKCKQAFAKSYHLSFDPSKPLVACIARLVPQKGLDLIEHALFQTLELGGQFVLLGSSPIAHISTHFQRLEQSLLYSQDAKVILGYSEELAKQLFSAADMTLIPSLFEPCGLTQLIGFRYGALALARETGGLKDTVIDVDNHPLKDALGNGFSFLYPDYQGVGYALTRALDMWKNNPKMWQKIVKRVSSQDVSWRHSAKEYETLYKAVLSKS